MTFHLPATPREVAAYCADPNSPRADQIQIHDLYDAASKVKGVRFEDSEFTRLAYVCEAWSKPITIRICTMPDEAGKWRSRLCLAAHPWSLARWCGVCAAGGLWTTLSRGCTGSARSAAAWCR